MTSDLGLVASVLFSPVVDVAYAPEAEVANGIINGPQFSNTERESQTYTVGFDYDVFENATLSGSYTYSESTSNAFQRRFETLVRITELFPFFGPAYDPDNPRHAIVPSPFGGTAQIACVPTGFGINLDETSPELLDAQCQALISGDPDLAFNPFGDGSSVSGADPNIFFLDVFTRDNKNISQSAEFSLSGEDFALPAGDIGYAIGGEWRTSEVDSKFVRRQHIHSARRGRLCGIR